MIVSIEDLAAGAAGAPLLDADGAPCDPLVAVDLSGGASPAVLARAVRAALGADRVLVGLGGAADTGLVSALDLTIATADAGRASVTAADPGERLAALRAAVTANPRAALVLREVLRATERLPVPAALDVESYAYSTLLGGTEFARWLRARGPRPLPPDAAEPVLLERAGDRLHITLNRPERRNAYGRQVRDALVDALRVALLDDGIARIVLDGAGPAFCSGGDLDEFGTAPDLATAHHVRTRAGAGGPLHRLAERAEVRVHGACVGAGVELPAFAGRVVARSDAVFRLPEVAMGLIPGAGGTVSVPRRIGRHRTLYLALTGEALPADTALAWGLVDEIAGEDRAR
ncbi:enoyl-CoA hydratase/isomerase family protein [Actinomadura algeriensis]|uniref:Enoyl-CoA hydratase/carnithine racemase n=1 Tax=Actinomadura algeriensis TaxID=1679523 RepID=A0ABR9JY97_9ACTN|nr:enoyl-CoA hydratase/isomerase family protein [Actinomadura algeriensis]MBE1535551.1 enoyl-CoA hydratase/carnithine racemase [Actinomadura algeriensis]